MGNCTIIDDIAPRLPPPEQRPYPVVKRIHKPPPLPPPPTSNSKQQLETVYELDRENYTDTPPLVKDNRANTVYIKKPPIFRPNSAFLENQNASSDSPKPKVLQYSSPNSVPYIPVNARPNTVYQAPQNQPFIQLPNPAAPNSLPQEQLFIPVPLPPMVTNSLNNSARVYSSPMSRSSLGTPEIPKIKQVRFETPEKETHSAKLPTPVNTDVISKNFVKPVYDVVKWRNLIEHLINDLKLMSYSQTSGSNFGTYKELRTFLTSIPSITNLEKAWVIYVWICNNIEYDVEGYKTGFLVDLSPERVFSTGKTISWGYANLFSDICIYAGIKCISISGYAKGLSFKHNRGFVDTNHEWNAIEINEVWHLVDCTWGAGFIDEKDKFEHKFVPHYFMTPPQIFIFDHYSPNFQLQAQKMSLKRYEKFPLLKLRYFLADVQCITHDIFADVYPNETSFMMVFTCAEEYTLSGNLEKVNGELIEKAIVTQFREENSTFEMYIQLPVGDDCLLNLFTKCDDDEWVFSGEVFLHGTPNISITKNITQPVYSVNTNLYMVKPVEWRINLDRDIDYEVQVNEDANVELVNKTRKYYYAEEEEEEEDVENSYTNDNQERIVQVHYEIEPENEENEQYYQVYKTTYN